MKRNYLLYILLLWLIVVIVAKYATVKTVHARLINDVLAKIALANDLLVVAKNKSMNTQEIRDLYAHALRLYIAARITGSAVDDILQQVFLKIHKRADTIRNTSAIKSRLYRTTQHTIIDRYRKHYDKNEALVQNSFWDQQEKDTSTKKKKTVLNNISSCLIPMIENLDEQSKKVMELYINKLYTYQEIANELGLSLPNIKIIIHRAKKKLKNMYTQCCTIYTHDDGTIIDTWCRNEDCYCDNTTTHE